MPKTQTSMWKSNEGEHVAAWGPLDSQRTRHTPKHHLSAHHLWVQSNSEAQPCYSSAMTAPFPVVPKVPREIQRCVTPVSPQGLVKGHRPRAQPSHLRAHSRGCLGSRDRRAWIDERKRCGEGRHGVTEQAGARSSPDRAMSNSAAGGCIAAPTSQPGPLNVPTTDPAPLSQGGSQFMPNTARSRSPSTPTEAGSKHFPLLSHPSSPFPFKLPVGFR